MKSIYELKRYKNSKSSGLIEALKLYVEYTEPAIRTDTKEIMYCLDNWNFIYNDPFYALGLYKNGQLIGFSELAYFEKEKFVVVDYLVIHENNRKNNTFYQFLDEIKDFLLDEKLEYNYIVAEVACYQDNLEPPESSKLLIRLLKMSRFGVVKCNYYVPRVGMNDFESAMRSVMMIYSLNDSKQIKQETFLQIVTTIYKKYYQRWHNLFASNEEKLIYDIEISDLISKVTKQIANKKSIEINGLSGLFSVKTDFSGEIKSRRLLKILTALLLFIVSFSIVGGIFSLLKSKLGWDTDPSSAIIATAAGLTVFLAAVLFEKSSNVFSNFFEKIIEKF